MIYLLFAAWTLLFLCTFSYFMDQRDNERKEYCVSYTMKTTAGTVTGFMNLEWGRKTELQKIRDYIKKTVTEEQDKAGEATPVGDVVILNVFEKPWN